MNRLTYSTLISGLLLLLISVNATAETRYVTSRILLGVHQQPTEESPLVQSIASGVTVKVLQTRSGFSKIRLADGTEGWVSSTFLVKEQPATARYDDLFKEHQKKLAAMKLLNEKVTKLERTMQTRDDQLSNARTTIAELKKNQGSKTQPAATSNTDTEALGKAQQEIKALKARLTELQSEQKKAKQTVVKDAPLKLTALQQENTNLQARIEAALASLEGKTIPGPEELAAIRPHFPAWYWGLLIAMLLLGAIIGIIWLDQRNRRRHGGFRI